MTWKLRWWSLNSKLNSNNLNIFRFIYAAVCVFIVFMIRKKSSHHHFSLPRPLFTVGKRYWPYYSIREGEIKLGHWENINNIVKILRLHFCSSFPPFTLVCFHSSEKIKLNVSSEEPEYSGFGPQGNSHCLEIFHTFIQQKTRYDGKQRYRRS